VVTGATGAIGKAIASELIARGVTVCAVGSKPETLAELARTTGWQPDQVCYCPVDLAVEADIAEFCSTCVQRWPVIQMLVHCAATIELGELSCARVEDFDRQYRINVRAPYQITQALLPRLRAAKGQIVFINSTTGLRGKKERGQYSATKHALRAIADSLREEVNQDGVRVLSVFLGRTASRMQVAVFPSDRPYCSEKLLQPSDVASVVVHALEMPATAEVTDVWIRPLIKSY